MLDMSSSDLSAGKFKMDTDATEINASESVGRPIRAEVQPGFNGRVSIRLHPGRDFFPIPKHEGCQFRGDKALPESPHPLPDLVMGKLAGANTKVTNWLAAGEQNALLFVNDPVAALQAAGVGLTRAEAKAVSRSHAALREDAALPPGGRITALAVSATKRGKVGDGRPHAPHKPIEKTSGGDTRDCGC